MSLLFPRGAAAHGQTRGDDVGNLLETVRARGAGGRTAAPVTFDSSMAIPAVWSCVGMISDLISSMPVDCFRRGPSGVAEEVTKPPVLTTPGGDGVEIDEWLYMSQVALELRGNSYGQIVARDGLGFPSQIELLHPDTVSVRRNALTGRPEYKVGQKVLDAVDVWHERARVVPGSLTGRSVIEAAATTLGVTLAAQQFGSDWFGDGAHPSSVFMNKNQEKIDQGQAKSFKEKVRAAMSGNREPLVLGSGWEYQQIQVAANESQFLETMGAGVNEVARMFLVPTEMIGGSAGSSVTYANVEQRGIHFLTYGLGPRILRREKALSRLTARPRFVKLNRGALLANDLLSRYRSYETGIRNSFLAIDEVREMEDREPLTDEQIAQLQLVKSPPAPVPVTVEV